MKGKFEYKDENGNVQTMLVKPLPVKYLGDYFVILKKFRSIKYDDSLSEEANNALFIDALDKATIDSVSEMCVETVKKSTGWSKDVVDDFVSENFFSFFPVMLTANVPNNE